MHAQHSCGSCHPYAVHMASAGGITHLCPDWCAQYVTACGVELGLPVDFCATNASNDGYCYPTIANNDSPTTYEVKPYFTGLEKPLGDRLVGASQQCCCCYHHT
jgi:hypothetical protein